MPKRKKGETEKDYMKRCMPEVMREGGKTVKQAAGKCYGMARNGKKGGKK